MTLGPYELNSVYCEDCLEAMRKLPDKSCVVITDPPYGIGESNERNATRINLAQPTNYGHYDWDKKPATPEQIAELMRAGFSHCVFGGNYFHLPPATCWIVWDKDNTGDFADCELAWTSFPGAVRKFKWRWNGMLQEKGGRDKEIRQHPTQKPLPLMRWIIEKYTQPDDIILDPFAGSGTTLVAAKQLGRKFLGFEIEPKYVEICKQRLAQDVLDFSVETV